MAFSYYTYTGDGTTTQFPVAFGYIRREHVLATVAGAPATFTFVNSTTIQMDAPPANGAVVRVYRQTPLTAPLVNFTDGSTLVAADLDTNALQSIYTQQELDDSLVDGLAGVIPNGDKGDITTSAGGSVWVIDNGAVTTAKLASVIAPTVSSINGGPLAGFRNRIINGGMVVDQRNNGSSISSGVNAITYGVDRWYVYALGAAVTLQRVGSSAARFESALRLTGAASNTFAMIGQRIEVSNSLDLANQLNGGGGYVSLSFAAATSASKTVTWKIFYANAANNFATKTEIGSGTQATTSSLTTYVASAFLLPAIATTGLSVEFSVDNLTSGTFDLTGVQLEPGPVATPFEQRPIGTELALCQRYFQRKVLDMRVFATGAGYAYAFPQHLPVSMRAIPNVAFVSNAAALNTASVAVLPRSADTIRFTVTSSALGDMFREDLYSFSSEL
jgi:hypothetical protein